MSVQDHLCSARIPTPVLTGLLIPASLLIILAIVPPHAFDLSVSKLFFSDGWPWHRNEVFTTIFYRLPKLVPAIVATVLLVRLAVVLAQGRRILEEEASRRALYVVIAMGACAAAVWWLKSTTGVACPWSVEPFGGALPMTDPAFGLTDVPGRCWPSGHAGTGFVFIAFYFALKDVRPRAAAGALLFAVAFGLLCGAVRVMEGAHFVSHVLVTGIVDWLICAALHALILEDRSSPAFAKPLSERGLVLLTAFWWTFVLNMPFLARAADLSEPNFAWSMREALTLAGLSFGLLFISIALLTLVMALPRPVRRAVLVLLSLTGAIFFAGTLVYGIAFDPNMARNVISTDVHEASAYFSARTLLLALAAGLPPVLAASAADMTPAGLRPAAVRGGVAILALAAGAGALFTQMNTLAAVMRNDKALRYLITPVNVPYSLAATLARDASPDAAQKRIVDPKPEFSVRLSRPAVLLVVIGETTRSASWGLAGYARDTTPALRAEGVISHSSVTAAPTTTAAASSARRLCRRSSPVRARTSSGSTTRAVARARVRAPRCEAPTRRAPPAPRAGALTASFSTSSTPTSRTFPPTVRRCSSTTCTASTARATTRTRPRTPRSGRPNAPTQTSAPARRRASSTPTTTPCATPTACWRAS